jgi:bacillithiol system protein YtxJ
MEMPEKVEQVEELEELLKSKNNFFLLKHSLTCTISRAAFKEYEKFADEHKEIPTYYLAVQDSRPLSNEIVAKFQIRHESPQALLFSDGKVVWHASHWKITKQSLADSLTNHQ